MGSSGRLYTLVAEVIRARLGHSRRLAPRDPRAPAFVIMM
jgi:hypothetical protein